MPDCANCPFAVDGKPPHRPVYATLPAKVQAVLVAESPGAQEIADGRPLIGPTGSMLRNEGLEMGVAWGDVALINAVLCQPPPGVKDGDYRKAVKCCSDEFKKALTTARERKVAHQQPTLCAGKYATLAFTGKKPKVAKVRGFIRATEDGYQYIITWHPTFAFFHSVWNKGEFMVDLDRWWRAATGRLKRLRPDINLQMEVADVVARAKVDGMVMVDIETTFEQLEVCTVKTIGFGNHNWGASFVYSELQNGKLQALKDMCADPSITKWMMNGIGFDKVVMERYGWTFNNVEDIRDSRQAMSPTSNLGLAYQASLFLDMHPWKEDEENDDDTKGAVNTSDVTKLREYNSWDCVVTGNIVIKHKSEPEWKEERVQHIYEVHKKTSHIAANMRRVGFAVDEQRRVALSNELQKMHAERQEKLLSLVNIDGWSGTSNEMRALIFRRHAVPGQKNFDVQDPIDPVMYTDEEMTTCSVDKDSLLNLVIDPLVPEELKNIIDAYWHYHAPSKARMTYVDGEKVLSSIIDGRLHPEWNSCGTETMRWSCKRPNIMNLSEEKKEGQNLGGALPNIRQMYCAKPGYVLVHADWSQQEIRVMECASGDEALWKALNSDDFYSALARQWFKLPPDCNVKKENPRMRASTKSTYLAWQYAASFQTGFRTQLKTNRHIKWNDCKLLWEHGANRTFLGIQRYWKEQLEFVSRMGYSEGFLLRGRCVYPAMPELSKLVNYPIQRTAGEMAALSQIEICEQIEKQKLDANMVTILHDAFDVEVREDQAGYVKDIMQKAMVGPWTINGRTREFPVDIKVGKYWSEV